MSGYPVSSPSGYSRHAAVTVRWPDQALSTQQVQLVAGERYYLQQGKEPVPDPLGG